MLDWLAERGVETLVVLTKGDKLKPMRRAKRAKELKAQLGGRSVPVLLTSSQAKQGIYELWKVLRDRL